MVVVEGGRAEETTVPKGANAVGVKGVVGMRIG